MINTEGQTEIAEQASAVDMVDLPEPPASFTFEDFPSAEGMTDIDSYLQMADDFSNYLTWDPWHFGYTY